MVEEVLECSGTGLLQRIHDCMGSRAHVDGYVLPQVMNVGGVVHVGVADKNSVDASLLLREAKVFKVVLAVDSFQLWEQACDLEVENTVALTWLQELGEVFPRLTEAHPEVQEDLRVVVFQEDLVAPDLVYSTVE